MENNIVKNLRPMKFGIVLSLLTIAFGFGFGGAFGAAEDALKDHLKGKAQPVLSTVYKGDEAEMKKVLDKSWTYFKRAHLHANGLGIIALGLIFLASFLSFDTRIKVVAGWFLGLGAFNYSYFWMLAGLRAPVLGSTGAAKESLKWLAVPSAGMLIIGLAIILFFTVLALFSDKGGEGGKLS